LHAKKKMKQYVDNLQIVTINTFPFNYFLKLLCVNNEDVDIMVYKKLWINTTVLVNYMR